MSLNVVVLAAGQGTRMRSERPKVLHEIGGRALLAHVLEVARALDPKAIHVVYGHGGERVREAFAEPDIQWWPQEPQLGTGHAVMQAMDGIGDGERVLVLYADVPLLRAASLAALVEGSAGGAVGILTAKVSDPTGYGRIVRDASGNVTQIVEQKDTNPQQAAIDEINSGIMVFEGDQLKHWLGSLGNDNAQNEYYLTDVIEMAVAESCPVRASIVPNAIEVLGINDKKQLALAERIYQRRCADELLEKGVTLIDPDRFDVRGKLDVGRDVVIDVGAVFVGNVRLGDRVRIGPYAVIANSDLGDGTVVHSHSSIFGSTSGKDCHIGPFARLRPGTQMADGSKAGNFVEIKNSSIGDGSKINHLSYIGDTSMGADVNVGAGSVTCNYDGANKHQTTIGSNVFVGSGVLMVAPVTIGDGATIGAGSTISKHAPGKELTIARARQVTIEGWTRPVRKPK